MRRGDIVTVALKGDFGKPRPALVVQNDEVFDVETTLVSLITTGTAIDTAFRLKVEPSSGNGLRQTSYVMLDKTAMTRREKCGPVIGRFTSEQMAEIDIRLAFIFGLTGQGVQPT